MLAEPLISVITVCYNSAATIERALKSVADQNWPRVEHIVIDGASKDETVEIIGNFRSRLALVLSEPDEGIYDAMNKGLKLASGDIVCFLNADDQYVSSSILSRVAQEMLGYKLDALFGDVAFFDSDNPQRLIRRYRSDRFSPERLAWGWMPAHPSLFFTKQVVKRVGLFKTNYRIAGDFDFIARAFHRQNLRYRHIPEVLVHMQAGGVSTAGLRSKIKLNQEVLRACRENGIKTNILMILSKYPMKLMELIYK